MPSVGQFGESLINKLDTAKDDVQADKKEDNSPETVEQTVEKEEQAEEEEEDSPEADEQTVEKEESTGEDSSP